MSLRDLEEVCCFNLQCNGQDVLTATRTKRNTRLQAISEVCAVHVDRISIYYYDFSK